MDHSKNHLPSDDPNSYCRLCFSDRNLVPLFPSDGPPRQMLLDLIAALVGIQIECGADIPCSICWKCAVALEDFQLFRQRSCEHDAIVRETLTNFNVPNEFEDQDFISSSFEVSEINKSRQENGSSFMSFMQTFSNPSKESAVNGNESSLTPEFTCALCYVEFRSHASLQRHLDKNHSELRKQNSVDQKNYPAKRLRSSDHLVTIPRLTRMRQLRQFQCPPPDNQPSSENLFKCSFCPKSFKHGPSLNFHLKSHYEMLPFVCEFCDARFINEKGKIIHKGRYHFENGVKKPALPRGTFTCTLCNRNFVHRKYLWQHIRYKHPELCLPDGSDPTLIMLPPIGMPNLEESFKNQAEDPLLEIKTEMDDSDSYCPLWD